MTCATGNYIFCCFLLRCVVFLVGQQDSDRIEVSNTTAGELRLKVHNLVPSDSARYTCTASSDDDLGIHEMTASITVHCKL